MAKQKSGHKDHNKMIHATVAFTRRNKVTGERLLAYLDHTGLSASRYIRGLIKADLDAKGWMLPGESMDQCANSDIGSIDDRQGRHGLDDEEEDI